MPAELDVHLICDNSATHKTPAIQRWLLAHPRFHLHFTPTYSSWLNLVERWFAELTTKWLRRGTHRSVAELEQAIQTWIDTWNQQPTAVRVDQDRRPDPRHHRHLLPTHQRLRTLAGRRQCRRRVCCGQGTRTSFPRTWPDWLMR